MSRSQQETASLLLKRTAALNTNSTPQEQTDGSLLYRPTFRRWIVLGLFMMIMFCSQLQYGLFISIVPQVGFVFKTAPSNVDFLTAIYPLAYALSIFPGMYCLGFFGMRRAVITGGFLCMTGSVLKVLSVMTKEGSVGIFDAPQFWVLALGSVFAGLSQVFILGMQPMLASVWFPDNERTLATSLATSPGLLGFACAILTSTHLTQLGCIDHSVGVTAAMCSAKNYNHVVSPSSSGVIGGVADGISGDTAGAPFIELLRQRVGKGLLLCFGVQAVLTFVSAVGLALVMTRRPVFRPSPTAEGWSSADDEDEEYAERASESGRLGEPRGATPTTSLFISTGGTQVPQGTTHNNSQRSSSSQAASKEAKKAELRSFKNYLVSWKLILTDKRLILMVLVFGVNAGSLAGFASVLTQAFTPFGITEDEIGWLGLTAIGLAAVASSILPSVLCKRFGPGYKKPWMILHAAQTLCFAVLTLLIVVVSSQNNSGSSPAYFIPAVFVLYTLIESFLLPVFAVLMEMAAATIYPKPAVVAGYLVVGLVCLWNAVISGILAKYVGTLEPAVADGGVGGSLSVGASGSRSGSGDFSSFSSSSSSGSRSQLAHHLSLSPNPNLVAQEGGIRNIFLVLLGVMLLNGFILAKFVKERLGRR